jgi:RHS repeat-associated protein
MRFSTKYDDDESDLLYYGYRYYKASTGTWPNRDPMEEDGGANIYAFCNSDSINGLDLNGLTTVIDVLNQFFSPSKSEVLWVMGPGDEYTTHMKNWNAVKDCVKRVELDIMGNCLKWLAIHKTTTGWAPKASPSFSHDPNAYEIPVRSPAGTDPYSAGLDYFIYNTTGHVDNNLWYSSVGSSTFLATVDDLNCCTKEATINFWIYNCMSKGSFGPFSAFFPKAGQANQYEWWNWKEMLFWGSGSGGIGGSSTGGGSWSW